MIPSSSQNDSYLRYHISRFQSFSRSYREPKRRGGFAACMFVFVLGTLENIGFVANMSTMVLYFHHVLHFDFSTSANVFTNYLASTFLLTMLGGFISDTYLSRLNTCLIFGFLEITGLLMVTIQANSKNLQPDPCYKPRCVNGGEAIMFYPSLSILALGCGGVKGSVAALGADQFDRNDPEGVRGVASYFNFYQFSTTIGSLIGVTVVVWIALDKGWQWAFFTGFATALLGFVALAIGKPFYLIQPLADSAVVRISKVVVAAIQNRNLKLPENSDELCEINDKENENSEEKLAHTNQFRFLDKAAIFHDRKTTICTVTQVEEVKILLRTLPLIGSTIIMNTCLAQLQTFSVLQGSYMEPHLSKLKIPTPSIPVIPLLFMVVLLPLYEFFFIPFARRITRHPNGITQLQRVGIGLFLSAISMVIAALVEVQRRKQAMIKNRKISVFWLSFQYGVFGVADMFAMVGVTEFFYKESPSGMRSMATSFALLSLSFGYFLSTAFVNVVNGVTEKIRGDGKGWLQALDDLNDNRLDCFYWFLAVVSGVNFVNYLLWASWYKSRLDVKGFD